MGRSLFGRSSAIACASAAVLLLLAAATASAETRYYRFELSTESPGHQFASEIVRTRDTQGGYAEVQFDDRHRVLKTTGFFGSKITSSTKYLYSGNDQFEYGQEFFDLNGNLTGRSKVERDATGRAIRTNSYTTAGRLTGYNTHSHSGNVVEAASYNAAGKRLGGCTYIYSNDLLSKSSCPIGDTRVDTDYDLNTGLKTSAEQFTNRALEYRTKHTHDNNGDLIRVDAYKPDGKWFAMTAYSENRMTQRVYKYPDGTSEEVDFSYDPRDWHKDTRISINGALITVVTYDTDEDGTVTKTIANSPSGQLMAEYPDQLVLDVSRDGHPVSGRTDFILHKQGNWW